jgi:hypothetical protein
VAFGISGTAYFAKDILLSLSHTVKVISMYSLSLMLFLGSSITTYTISIILIILSLSMYSFSTVYIWKKYNPNRIYKFTLLAISTILLLLLGYGVQIGYIANTPEYIVFTSYGFIILILSVLIPADIVEEDPIEYEFNVKDSISINDTNKSIGTITVKNNSRFTRKFSIPSIECVFNYRNEEKKIRTSVSTKNNTSLESIKDDKIELDIIANLNHIKKDNDMFSGISSSSEFRLNYEEPDSIKDGINKIKIESKDD